jgi:hypothetical protein
MKEVTGLKNLDMHATPLDADPRPCSVFSSVFETQTNHHRVQAGLEKEVEEICAYKQDL